MHMHRVLCVYRLIWQNWKSAYFRAEEYAKETRLSKEILVKSKWMMQLLWGALIGAPVVFLEDWYTTNSPNKAEVVPMPSFAQIIHSECPIV